MERILLQIIFAFSIVTQVYGQTLIMNEVSNGPSGNQEYVEFVVVSDAVTYDCAASSPPCIDIRGWIFDDNSGYHSVGEGVAPGAVRFANVPFWSCLPLGTIIVIYNNAETNTSIPGPDVSMADGNCRLIVPLNDPAYFEFNATTPGDVACSYPALGWGTDPSPTWGSNTVLANTGDCARIVDLSGCEVFSVCYAAADSNNLIYFASGGSGSDNVWYFNDGNPNDQSNWSEGCADPSTCGANVQTPGAPNNPANAAYIAQFNNGCTPITPVSGTTVVDNHEQCGCDGEATASGSGSIGPYTYEWFDATMTPIGQTTGTATGLCPGNYFVTITSSIDCDVTQSITINPGSGTPTYTISYTDPSACGISDGTIIISGLIAATDYTVSYEVNGVNTGTTPQTTNGAGEIVINGLNSGTYSNFLVTLNACSGSNAASVTLTAPVGPSINDLSDQIVCDSYTLPTITGTDLSGSEGYFTAPNGGGVQLTAGSTVTSTQTIYIYDINGTCSDEETVLVTVNNTPAIDPIADATACATYALPTISGTNLTGNEAFYNNSQALGGTVVSGPITSTQTIWVYDEEGACSDEISFLVTINPLPEASIGGGGVFCNPPPSFSPVNIGILNIGTPDYTLTYTVNGVPTSVTVTNPQNIYLGGTGGITTITLVSISDQYCTNTLTGSATIEITTNYNMPVIVNGDSTYCLGDDAAIMSVVPNGTAVWYNASGDWGFR